MTTFPESPGNWRWYKALAGLVLFASGAYTVLFYAAEAMSERDYSGINDPHLRVGYCMASNTFNPDKYQFAETAGRPPDFEMFSVVMPHALAGVITDQKKAAILALREREELRVRAVRLSFFLADNCGYRQVAWPPGTTPLDISLKWLQHDATFLFFLERVKADPDAADLAFQALARSSAGRRTARF